MPISPEMILLTVLLLAVGTAPLMYLTIAVLDKTAPLGDRLRLGLISAVLAMQIIELSLFLIEKHSVYPQEPSNLK